MNGNRLGATALFISCFIMAGTVHAQQEQQPLSDSVFAKSTEKELLKFFQWVMGQVETNAQTSTNYGLQTKERIIWMFRNTGQNFNLSKKIVGNTQMGTIVGLAKYDNGKPGIVVNLGYLVDHYWENYNSNSPLGAQELNDLIVMFSHEVIHLQHGPLVIEAMKTDPPLVGFEERRTWAQSVIEDIRPLIAKGQPVHADYAVAEILLRFCGDDMDCVAFKTFTGTRTAH